MSFILTVTDFSDSSAKSLNYACRLAKACNLSVILTHNFSIPIAFYENTPIPTIAIEDGKKIVEEKMADSLNLLKLEHPGVNITTQIIYGTLLDALDEYENQPEKPWLTIIANDNEDSNNWLDDNVVDALKELPYPVLAIPSGTTYKPVRNICLACDPKQISGKLPINEIKNMITTLGAQLHIFTVDTDTDERKATATNSLQSIFSSLSPLYHFAENENVDEAIHDFITANNIDWLGIIPHHHSFFEGLFHKSHTKAITRSSHIPVLSFHEISN